MGGAIRVSKRKNRKIGIKRGKFSYNRYSMMDSNTMDERLRLDNECIALVKRGNREAYSAIVKAYMKRAYYIALGFVKTEADALDVSQEAFIKAFRHIKKFKPGHDFFPWFYQILKNLCLDWLRKSKRRDEIPLEDVNAKLADSPQPDQMLKIAVWKGIEKLPIEQREILILRYFQGFSYKEIAQILGKPMGSVMSALYYAKKKLRAKIGDYFDDTRRN